MLDFEVKELTNIKFSYDDLLDYYYEIIGNYQHLKWTPIETNIGYHKVHNIYSWAIQSNLKDPTKPCPPYDIKHDTEVIGTFDNPTELIFGFAKFLIDAIPEIRQTVISAHPPGTMINQHIDNYEFLKIHIPIKTNKNSFFVFEDKKYNLEIGKAYLINTMREHGTTNDGDTDRIHLIFKIPVAVVDDLLSTEWILDPKQIDFDILPLTNIKFSFTELENYFLDIKQHYDYLRWTMPDIPNTQLGGLYGYPILTNKEDPEECIDPPGLRNDKAKYEPLNKPTKMLKGFAKKLYTKFPYMEELVITGHPSNTGIPPHVDKDEHIRIHFPIYANKQSHFIINENDYVLKPGTVYVVNTKRIHTTINNGNSDRIHLHFKIPIGKLNTFLKMDIKL